MTPNEPGQPPPHVAEAIKEFQRLRALDVKEIMASPQNRVALIDILRRVMDTPDVRQFLFAVSQMSHVGIVPNRDPDMTVLRRFFQECPDFGLFIVSAACNFTTLVMSHVDLCAEVLQRPEQQPGEPTS